MFDRSGQGITFGQWPDRIFLRVIARENRWSSFGCFVSTSSKQWKYERTMPNVPLHLHQGPATKSAAPSSGALHKFLKNVAPIYRSLLNVEAWQWGLRNSATVDGNHPMIAGVSVLARSPSNSI